MAKYFITKTWGFYPDSYPILGFGNNGALRSYLKETESDLDSWVIIAGTKGHRTESEQRGKLLGIVRLGRNQVDTEMVLNQIGTEINSRDRDSEGRYKWPFGLPMLEAYKFDNFPEVSEVFGDYLPGIVWASTARNIEEATNAPDNLKERIHALPKTKCAIHDIPVFEDEMYRNELHELRRKPKHTGPAPSEHRSGSTTKLGQPVTYLLKLTGLNRREIVKVGYTNDIERRINELNAGLIPSVSKLKWELEFIQPLPSSIAAYTLEQMIHKELANKLVPGESEIYSMKVKDCQSVINQLIWNVEFMKSQFQEQYANDFEIIKDKETEFDQGSHSMEE